MKETNNRHGRVPLILSAFFCPGAGQFMQRRWIAAVFFSVTFLIFAALVMVEVLRPMFHNVTVALDWASEGETSGQLWQISPKRLLVYFGAALAIYLVNLLDVARPTPPKTPPPLPPAPR